MKRGRGRGEFIYGREGLIGERKASEIGLHAVRDASGEVGFRVIVGGGMGRTPIVGHVIREFLPWPHFLTYIEAILRVYNRYGRRDNMYKARIKILVKAEGERFIRKVEDEFAAILERDVDGSAHIISQREFDRVAAGFVLLVPLAAIRFLPGLLRRGGGARS